ncbi:uncharacterized protein LOC130932851 isoform X2 [Arachis stenosperma]|uniref:uncharacterized protein LOC130932851 isoform X2 n=1 Tax=Arachis stenosperma TaxID=217475 RepID=UPI0025AB8928|nr:uncharacterized protein LOC130932851 isoform X2 [Arachis stenosperma]
MFVVANISVFILVMQILQIFQGNCVARFLGRISFQPVRENPLLGPSSSTTTKIGEEKKEEEKKKEKKKEKKNEEKKEEESPTEEIVLKVDMHCEAYARKVAKALKGCQGHSFSSFSKRYDAAKESNTSCLILYKPILKDLSPWFHMDVTGTEDGIKEPIATFSACFGAAFIMLYPTKYATMLAEKMEKHGATGWLVKTGWSGGMVMVVVSSYPTQEKSLMLFTLEAS